MIFFESFGYCFIQVHKNFIGVDCTLSEKAWEFLLLENLIWAYCGLELFNRDGFSARVDSKGASAETDFPLAHKG